jgi:dTMP kinase
MAGKRGRFITFEGIDGCGKTTQLEMLAERLRALNMPVTRAREPGGTAVGDAIRRILLDSATVGLAPVAEVLLYFASRAQNVDEVIGPALESGRVVLCDRFVDASAAYQGAGRGLGRELIENLERIACRGVKPDLTFILDIEPATSIRRALERNRDAAGTGAADESRFERESLEFFSRVRGAYLEIAAREPGRVLVINGERSQQAVQQEVWRHVWERIKNEE